MSNVQGQGEAQIRTSSGHHLFNCLLSVGVQREDGVSSGLEAASSAGGSSAYQPISTGPVKAMVPAITQSPHAVVEASSYLMLVPLFFRQLLLITQMPRSGTQTQTSVNSLGEMLMSWRSSFQTATGQIFWDLGLEGTVMCSLLPEIRATCILCIWWAKIPFL